MLKKFEIRNLGIHSEICFRTNDNQSEKSFQSRLLQIRDFGPNEICIRTENVIRINSDRRLIRIEVD